MAREINLKKHEDCKSILFRLLLKMYSITKIKWIHLFGPMLSSFSFFFFHFKIMSDILGLKISFCAQRRALTEHHP